MLLCIRSVVWQHKACVNSIFLRNRKHVPCFSVKLENHKWKFGRTRNAVRTRATGYLTSRLGFNIFIRFSVIGRGHFLIPWSHAGNLKKPGLDSVKQSLLPTK